MNQSDDSFLWQPDEKELDRYLAFADGEDFYVFHSNRFADNCKRFLSAFNSLYPKTRMAYSVKTNYLPEAISIVNDLEWYSEVVSGFEYDLVKSLQVSGKDIVFNGPIKNNQELLKAVSDGATVNIDSVGELSRIENVCRANNLEARIGVRLNFSDTLDCHSRFGLAQEDARGVIKFIQDSSFLNLHGLHAHYCFAEKKPESYTELVSNTLNLIDDLSPLLWESIEVLNFGGGFFSPMPSKMAANWNHQIPSFNDYALAITEPLNKRFSESDISPPQLTLEPGLAVIADAMSFACRVDNVKRIADRDVAILTGSVYNIKPTKSAINLPWSQYRKGLKPIEFKGGLSGYTCMEDDIMESDFEGYIAADDVFIFGNVGAYTTVLQPPFIRLAPGVLASKDDEIVTLVKAETNEEFFKYRFNLDKSLIA